MDFGNPGRAVQSHGQRFEQIQDQDASSTVRSHSVIAMGTYRFGQNLASIDSGIRRNVIQIQGLTVVSETKAKIMPPYLAVEFGQFLRKCVWVVLLLVR